MKEEKQETSKTPRKLSRLANLVAGIMLARETQSKLLGNPRASLRLIDTYAAQCNKCYKWRVIPTQEEYEDIRSKLPEDPFFCDRKPSVSCDDPAEIEYDSTRTWVIDRPGVPKTPEGFKRSLVLRRDFSKMDAYYITPTGKKLRTRNEIAAFLEANPKYKDVPLSSFHFSSPKVMEDTIPEDLRRLSASSNSKKKIKVSKDSA